MNNKFIGIGLGLLSIILCSYFFLFRHSHLHNPRREIKVALLLPISHPSLDAIQQGFIDSLEKNKVYSYSFKTYNGNGNRTLMLAQAEEVVTSNYDLIVPIATAPAVMVQELSIRKRNYTPIIALAADIAPQKTLCPHITGVSDNIPISEQRDALVFIKPNIKKLSLVYNASEPRLEMIARQAVNIFKERNISLLLLPMYQLQDLHTKVPTLLYSSESEGIIILKDNLVVSGIDALIKYCMKNKLLLFASDLDSVEKGAALGFGVHEYDIGFEGGKLAHHILSEKIMPSEIPFVTMNNFKIKINRATMHQQGLDIDKPIIYFMEKGEVYTPKENS